MRRRVDHAAPRPGARSRTPGWRHCPRPPPGRRPGARSRGPRRGPRRPPGRRGDGSGAGPEVGAGGVGEVGEGECPADDRDRVARLEPGLAIRPMAAPIAQPAAKVGASSRLLDLEQRRRRQRTVHLGRSGSIPRAGGPARTARRRPCPVSPSNVTGASNRAPRGKTRMAARRVADAEADRALLRVARIGRPAVAAVADGRAVVDARHALEERHEGHLGGFDDAADPDLAGRERADRGRRRVGDPQERSIVARARARGGPGRRRRPNPASAVSRGRPGTIHGPIVRDAARQPERRDGRHGHDDEHDPEPDGDDRPPQPEIEAPGGARG